jgi:hypothetical protein
VATILFAVLTAASNAAAVTTQHVASTSGPAQPSGWRLLLFLVRHPLWLLGWVGMAGSLVFQALALHFGPLSLVQPILVTELVLTLALRRLWLRQAVRPAAWWAAAVTSAGLAAFLALAAPREHSGARWALHWGGPVASCLVAAGVLVLLGLTGSPSRRAALFASATAVIWALEATFIKATTNDLTSFGVGGTLARGPLYALITLGVAGLFCEQTALHVGPLRNSQPFIVVLDPLISVVLGLWLYGERLTHSVVDLAGAGVAFVVMGVGAVALIRTTPESMRADAHLLTGSAPPAG